MKMKKHTKRAAAAALAVLFTIGLAACGKSEKTPEDTRSEYIYVAEYIKLPEEANGSFYNSRFLNNALYYTQYSYEQGSGMSSTEIMKFSLEDKQASPLPVSVSSDKNVDRFAVDKEENIYLVLYDYSAASPAEEGGEYSQPDVSVAKYDSQGNQLYEQNITELLQEDPDNVYVNSLEVDGQGRLYVQSSDVIRLFDSQGNYAGLIDNQDNWIHGMGTGKDGKVYFTYYDNSASGNNMALAEADFEGKKVGNVHPGYIGGNGNGAMPIGLEKDFMVQDGVKLYEYDIAAQKTEEVLSWLDSDINGQYVEMVGAMDDGRILAVISDWNTGDTEIALLTKTKSSEVPQKEQITIGTLSASQALQTAAVNFNKSNDKYHIDIKTYIDYNNWTETSYQDGITALNNDITGSNTPDLLDLSQLNVPQLAGKGAFEDLDPYLESSKVLDKDDFMKNILDSFRYDGRLVSIPSAFSLNTVIGKSSEVGGEMGWTLEEMIAFADEHEGAALFDYASKSSIMQYCMNYNKDAYVDWETGECHFDTPQFQALLEFVNRFPDETDWEADDRSQPAKIAAGDVLLANAYLYDFNSVQEYMAMFGEEPVTCIGYPNSEGAAGCILEVTEQYAIASKSEKKDGAWSFIEYFLSEQDTDSIFMHGFPTRQSAFDQRVKDVTTVEYVTDENGEPVLDENGEKIEAMGTSSISYGDWEYTYHTPTEEEIQLIKDLVEVAKPNPGMNLELNNIISEEAEAFWQGQKSAADVAKVIQSRAQLYVSENS